MSPTARVRRRPIPAATLIVLVLTGLLWSLAVAGPAEARTYTFKELRVKGKKARGKGKVVKTFRIVGVKPSAIVRARLVGPSGQKKVSIALVRRAARSRKRILRVRGAADRRSRARKGKRGSAGRRARSKRARASATTKLKVTTAPETTITGGPAEGSETTSTDAKLSFSSSSPAKARFYCSLDGAAFKACSSGITYSGLGVGTHRFRVYTVDRYGTVDPTPAERSWTVVSASAPAPAPDTGTSEPAPETSTGTADTTAPETVVTAGPADGSSTTSTSVSFSFSGSDDAGVAGYECSLDGAAFTACSSPKAYSGLGAGVHVFRVRARDAAGNVDPTPASRTWTIASSATVYQVSSSLAGDCSTDVTAQLLTWLGTVPENSTVLFSPNACYRIEGTLELRNRSLILDGNGATFRSFNAPTTGRALWRLWDSSATMRNMTLVGSYANGGVFSDTMQHAHGIDLRGTRAVVENVTMSDLGGDCVYFGLGAKRSSGAVRDSSCRRISRNGVSVVAGDDIRVERMTTDRIGYIAFDVEPNTGTGNGAARVVFDSNTIGTYYMKAYTVIGNAPVGDLEFTNNRVVGESLRIGVVDRTHRPQRVKISGNSSDTAATPSAMGIAGVDGITITGNHVPMTTGTMASVDRSCASVSGNTYPGGTREAYIGNSTC